jgi:hypothetical protein
VADLEQPHYTPFCSPPGLPFVLLTILLQNQTFSFLYSQTFPVLLSSIGGSSSSSSSSSSGSFQLSF